jgi:hypothetical protein
MYAILTSHKAHIITGVKGVQLQRCGWQGCRQMPHINAEYVHGCVWRISGIAGGLHFID